MPPKPISQYEKEKKIPLNGRRRWTGGCLGSLEIEERGSAVVRGYHCFLN